MNLKKYEKTILNLIIILFLSILFFNFFFINEVFPLSDEIIAIERYTDWHKFLWRNNVGNHTINSFLAVIIKTIFGENLLYYRFISFIFFSFVLIIFKKMYPSILLCCIFILIIISSQLLTNYIYIYRGYYSWAFLTVLNFFYLKKFLNDNLINTNFNILLVINLILICHSLITLYIIIPIFISIFFIFLKNYILEKKIDQIKINNFFFFFFIPAIIFYLIIIIIEGFTIIYFDNLNIEFFLSNFFDIIKNGFIPGLKNIFFNSHLNKFINDGNFFYKLYESLINNPLNIDKDSRQLEPQYTIMAVYLISLIILGYRTLLFKLNYFDFIIANIFIFFIFLNYIPEPRTHVGIVFFNIFYIFDKIYILKKIKIHYSFVILLLFTTIFLLSKTKIDENFNTVKPIVDRINSVKKLYKCHELNHLLNDEEIWVMKNFNKNDCKSYYDFKNKKNILTDLDK